MPPWLTAQYWEKIGHPEAWATIIGSGSAAIFTILSVTIAAVMTYRFTARHSRVVHNIAIRSDRLRRKIDALEKMWGLLGFMTMAEGEHAIVRFRVNDDKSKIYYCHYENLKVFILKETSNVFYKECAGLYMPKQTRDLLFSYRSILMGLFIRYEKDEDMKDQQLIPIENTEMVKKLQSIYENLNKELKAELERRYNQLILN